MSTRTEFKLLWDEKPLNLEELVNIYLDTGFKLFGQPFGAVASVPHTGRNGEIVYKKDQPILVQGVTKEIEA